MKNDVNRASIARKRNSIPRFGRFTLTMILSMDGQKQRLSFYTIDQKFVIGIHREQFRI